MSDEKEGPAGPVGVVIVGDLEITVTPLTLVEERSLRRQIRAGAAAAIGSGFSRCKALLADMKAADPVAYTEAVREITRRTLDSPSVSEEQFWEYRESPEGIATELYARGKKASGPALSLKGLRAVITPANVDDIIDQLRVVMEGQGGPKASTPPPSPEP